MIPFPRYDSDTLRISGGPPDWLLVGICGAGMRAFAEMLLDAGFRVAGTDVDATALSQLNERIGSKRSSGSVLQLIPWDATQLLQVSRSLTVVHSVAVPDTCLHLVHAKQLGVPVMSLPAALGAVLSGLRQICVAGTHGKTTTSGMIWWILQQCGIQPAGFIGGEFCSDAPSGSFGAGQVAVVESCEYRNSFLQLQPTTVVLTGIESDHFDCFKTDPAADAAFQQFAERIPKSGTLIVNTDSSRAKRISTFAKCRIITMGTHAGGEWTVSPGLPRQQSELNVEILQRRMPWASQSWMIRHLGVPVAELRLQVPGAHNALNALGAFVAAVTSDVPPVTAAAQLSAFTGMRRRFEYRGNWRGIDLIDDYAHHPSAVSAVCQTARDLFSERRLIAVFEPHQMSRTQKLFPEFSRALTQFDECLILPVLAARESASNIECSQLSAGLVRQIFDAGGRAFLMANLDQALRRLDHATRPGDVVITMGAGRTHQIHDEIHRRLLRNSAA